MFKSRQTGGKPTLIARPLWPSDGIVVMSALLLFGILVGLDNLKVSSALGLLPISRGRKWRLALAFGFWEALMPLVGLAFGHLLMRAAGEWAEAVGPMVLALCGVLVITQSLREGDAAEVAGSGWVAASLPLSLSFDNLFAGVGLGALGYPVLLSALVVGSLSASLCWAGFFLGGWLRRWIPARIELASGALLIALAAASAFLEIA